MLDYDFTEEPCMRRIDIHAHETEKAMSGDTALHIVVKWVVSLDSVDEL